MKFKLRAALLPIAAAGMIATPLLVGTSCAKDYKDLFFTIKNEKGLEIKFCNRGASIYSMKLNDETNKTSTFLTYHPEDKTKFINPNSQPYFHGKTLGRVAGRFENGKFTLDGKEYNVQVNEKSATKNNCLHGGYDSFCFRDYTRYVKDIKGATSAEDRTVVAFNYYSPADEAGFPEAIDAWIVYSLYKNVNKLDTTLIAIPTGKTLINLSTHSLFRLANEGDVLNYELTINANKRVRYVNESKKDKNGQIPQETEDYNTAYGSYFDFRTAKKIGKDIEAAKAYDPVSGGYDHIWYCGDQDVLDRYVELYNPANGIDLKVTAQSENVTGFILYSNDYPMANTIMSDGKQDALYAGITIEPYTYFTAKDLSPITYTPDNPFFTKYTYDISVK